MSFSVTPEVAWWSLSGHQGLGSTPQSCWRGGGRASKGKTEAWGFSQTCIRKRCLGIRVERCVCWGWGLNRWARLQLWRMGEGGLILSFGSRGEWARGRKWDGALTCVGVSA